MTEETLPEQIADRLRRDILRGALEPGAPIKEREQAGEMGVSRTPMREAIRILAKEGLVLLRPSRSPIVADPSFEEVTNAVDVLRALELLSGELACTRADDAEIVAIRALHERMSAVYDEIDALDLFEIDMSFHTAIVRAARNPVLMEMHRSLLARLWRVRYLSVSQQRDRKRVLMQHGAMVDGLERRDATQVLEEIDSHLAVLMENVRWLFARETDKSETAP